MTQLCLSLIKKHTDLERVEIIVIDNGSNDESSEYLKNLDWITLIIREKVAGESGARSHSNALNIALERVVTPYVLSIHTDTFIIDSSWLDYLLGKIDNDEKIAGVGSWKLEFKPIYKRVLKCMEKFWQVRVWYPLMGKDEGNIAGIGGNHYYLRSHCALYKTEYVKQYTDGFNDGGETAGKGMHKKLVEHGFVMRFLDSVELSQYVRHLNHATAILNPELHGKTTGKPKQFKRIEKELNEVVELVNSDL